MVEPPEDRRPPLTPQLALRVAIVGSVALALFAIIFFRLWFLQVLSGDQYVRAATVNRVRKLGIASPRGDVLDRNGSVLVDSNRALAVNISPPDLPVPVSLANVATIEHPPKRDAVVYNRLAHVLGMPTARRPCQLHMKKPNVFRLSPIACLVGQQITLVAYSDVTIKSGSTVSTAVQYYIAERDQQFPGVQVSRVYVTHYPRKTLAAQVLGTVGRITQSELKQRTYRGISRNAIIGQSGLEGQYNSFLQGKDGYQQVQINSLGEPVGDLRTQNPTAGHDLKLSLDANLEQVGQNALAQSISQNAGSGGAFVAMNPQNGEVYGMGSMPTYDPSVFTGNLAQSTYNQLTSVANGQPLLNRAISSVGPTGSAFKPITATAALQSGEWSTSQIFDDTGQFCVGSGGAQQCRHNSGHAVDGSLDLVNALKVSSDDFFYNLGARLNPNNPAAQANPLDTWARRFGIGRNPGVDLPSSEVATGTLPSARWRASRNRLEAECDAATGPFKGKRKHPPGGCGIADGTNRPWSIGDNESLAVGQGDVQVSPLQLSVAYAALANGGTIVRPHLALDVQNTAGTVLQRIDPPPSRHININPLYLETIRSGLRAAASQPGGTSDDVMGNFHQQVYGKTGTAQYFTANTDIESDYAWYACFVPATATSKPIVVVVWVEKGGFGDVGAAPVARQILSQWFYGKPGPYVTGKSTSL
jgi:penicillin-binding protein 2